MEIKDIVFSYGLPKKVERRILSISAQRIEELGLTSFDDQYRYVAGLIEKFQVEYIHRYAIRLDAPAFKNSDKLYPSQSLHDHLTTPDLLVEHPSSELSLDLVMARVDPHLSKENKYLLARLLDGVESNEMMVSNPERVTISTVTQRLEALTQYLERKVNIIFPERPIVSVNFNSERSPIRWGKRSYGDNPLAYFRKHFEVYAGRSRHKLRNVDSGLSDALYRCGQIDEAIPKRGNVCREPRSLEQVARIVGAYTKYGGNGRLSAKELGIDPHEVRKVWRKEKLIAQGGVQRRLPPDEVSRIIKAYELYGGNATVSAEKLGLDRSNVRNVWRRRGLKPVGKSSNNFTLEEKSNILKAHEFYNGNCSRTAKELGFSEGGVWKIWNQQGLKAVGSKFENQRKSIPH